MCYGGCELRVTVGMRAGSNPQMDRLRYSSDVHVSLDDEEMREVDPDEHRETLGAGIPQHLGQNLLLISAPILGVIIVNIDSVCPDVCHAPSSCFFLFVSRWNRAIFGRQFSICPST